MNRSEGCESSIRRSYFTVEHNLFLKRICPHLQQNDKQEWEILAKEFKKRFQVSKKPNELKEQFLVFEGIISNKELSEDEKSFMVQSRREGKTFSYIAQQLHRKENTIKNYYNRKYMKENKQENVENSQSISFQVCSPNETLNKAEITIDNLLDFDSDFQFFLKESKEEFESFCSCYK
jgi:hypothetical protein